MQINDQIYSNFKSKLDSSNHEEEIRLAWATLIESTLHIKGIHAEEDKRDMSFNNVLIEFKDHGLFHHSKESKKFIEATDQRIKKYVKRWSKSIKKPQSFFIGIVTDGVDMSLCQIINNEVKSGNLMPITQKNTEYVLEAINRQMRYALNSSTLIDLFGRNSSIGTSLIKDLFQTLEADLSDKQTNKTKLFYEEWGNLYGQVADIAAWKKKSMLTQLGFPVNSDLSHVLFCLNTYNSIIVKSLAAELVSTTDIAAYSNFSESLYLTDDESLLNKINEQVEQSHYFEMANIHNFVSEVLFSWYLSSKNKSATLIDSLRSLYEHMSLMNVNEHEAMRSGDALKNFYEDLIPDALRKTLGEFYTPDWMVQYMIEKLPSIEDRSILDPTCGSGSFLLEAISQKTTYFSKIGMAPDKQLAHIEKEVVGFDLNPLAVQTARVNYLFSIIDLVKRCPGITIEIPILLADAIYAPEVDKDSNLYTYTIGSKVANLTVSIPKELVDSRTDLVSTFELLNNHISNKDSFNIVLPTLKLKFPKANSSFFSSLQDTYDRIQDLHRKQWDGIWFQIIANFFWSIELPKFDFIIGNPPWVRWSSLPELYRERVKNTAIKYDIFSDHKYHGGNELDISALITYTVADRWLKKNGELSFLLPQEHLQNDSSSGFRQLSIKNDYLQPINIEDLKSLKIFKSAVNKPMIFTFVKTEKAIHFPVDYTIWSNVNNKKTVNPNRNLIDIKKTASKSKLKIKPLHNNIRSPWIFGSADDLSKFDKIIGEPTYKGRKGITTDLNGVFFPELLQRGTNNLVQIQTRPEAGRKNIGDKRKAWIEDSLVYPLIKGSSNIQPGYGTYDPKLRVILTNTGIGSKAYEEAVTKMNSLPKTLNYLTGFKNLLEDRSTFKKFMPGAPYWAVYNVGEYTLAPYKVVWSEIGQSLKASLFTDVNGKVFIPDHKTYFAAFDNIHDAVFLMCILNNSTISRLVTNSTVSTSRGDILKHLHLPKYDAKNKLHFQLVNEFLKSKKVDKKLNDDLTDRILF
ncbi:Eco57I restriction-modification methylase domain-containing protein [Limosilactobacillus reuteri]|uniref:Eco57I restriction-modification methylase domain-containing protein n=4 Tax=Limosilactobacillus reuteri TaxID=1598 RepID=UPI000990233E|nr:N-6 DNA methylase [Limosilactobacillus reuteri]WOZ75276.1 N-6 DNA methylase [Limosilactobacillus reuteri]